MAGTVFSLTVAILICFVNSEYLMRKNVEELTRLEIFSLHNALIDSARDTSPKGIDTVASYHGYPPKCKDRERDVACCVHGSPSFVAWHRLFVVQVEQAFKDKSLSIGVPYWDWTRELDHLPELVRDNVIPNIDGTLPVKNPWYATGINIGDKEYHTSRAIDPRLFQKVSPGEYTDLFEQVLHAYEYDSFCQFSVQFEVAHNFIHSLVGGRSQYSMSSLDFTSYDPIFFLHHSNVDRLYMIYQEIRKHRGTLANVGYNEICDVKEFLSPMEPFSRNTNPFSVSRDNSSPQKSLDSQVFGYRYDSLTLNGLDAADIVKLIKNRQSHDRVFADFRLHNIGGSADIRVTVCPGVAYRDDDHDKACVHAGDFFILGGNLEMDWSFSQPYHFEITKAVEKLGFPLDGNYHVEVDICSINGTQLPSSVLPHPSVNFRPAVGKTDPPIVHEDVEENHEDVSVRKNAEYLTREEIFQLRDALEKFQSDHSVDGYQAIAEFHGDPGKCPFPTDKNRTACCIHGKPNFPHWHRLLVVQVEDALRRRGSPIGVPYWDWTKPNAHIPALADEVQYIDPHTGIPHHNPFHDASVAFLGENVKTSRDVQPELSQTPKWGDHTELFDTFLLALEQDNYCDFEVQFEIAHNLIHALVGGNSKYGLSSLAYSAFDPIFYLHHSNIDRIWAIWIALQQHRRKPYKAHCAQSYIHLPLKPFAFSSQYNSNEKTFSHSTPTDIYDYEEELHYTYDSLEFGGMSIEELDNYINTQNKNKNRVFVGIQLHGIKKSGLATIYITPVEREKYTAGHFALLGGPSEMPWRFDRNYKHEITQALETLHLNWYQHYNVTIEIKEFDGTPIDIHEFPHIDIYYKSAVVTPEVSKIDLHVRKNVNHLNSEETLDLRRALAHLKGDKSIQGYQTLGRFHGATNWCQSPEAEKKVACCLHGMPTFPHWHRLLTVQAENALRKHGYKGSLPYWDWTQPLTSLPDIVSSATYKDPSNGNDIANPFYSAHIDDANQETERSVRDDLYQYPAYGEYTSIAKQVLLALEQENYCDFEIQFEIAHNFIHALVGGSKVYSMASLAYTAYDPLFYLHHSNTDRLWAVWQALQKYRGKPFNTANCAVNRIYKALAPFSLSSDVNPDLVTREHSFPYQIFDYKTNFHYEYDNLEFNGLSIPQLARVLEQNKAHDRSFVGFLLHGIGHSALTKFYICKKADDCHLAGEFYLLGDNNEMEWTADHLYKFDITKQLEDLHLHYDDHYTIKYEINDLDGTDLGSPFPHPTVVHDVGTSYIYGKEYIPVVTAASHVRHNLESLSLGEVESLRAAFLVIQEDHTYEKIASFHGKPGLCEHEGRKVACCVHGSPAFPAWHRLYVEQVEHALLDHGSSVAVPYWDWTSPFVKLPKLISKSTYYNSRNQRTDPNPFFSGRVAEEDVATTRDPQPELFNNDYFYEQALFALEQTNFCDFEIHFEILHNALHSWLGGHAKYSLSSLDYAAYDPVFFLHHANTDRIWAIWQELQRYRRLPYNEADCAINLMRKPLKPFGDNDNKDKVTQKYSHPVDTFDYRNNFQYEYDNLEFNQQTIPQLENLLKHQQDHGRIFAGFLIHNIGLTADVVIKVCVSTGFQGKKSCNHKAGMFSILGGETEMPFAFDRLYKHEITKAIKGLNLEVKNTANFELKIEIHAANGSLLDPHILHDPSIIYVPGTEEVEEHNGVVSPYLVRKHAETLSPLEVYHLFKALVSLKADKSAVGFQSIAAFHALPPLCPSPTASKRYACCIHGAASFLQWHRLYTVQFEEALRRHGSLVGVPYWDWTRVSLHLPPLVSQDNYTNIFNTAWTHNPFTKAKIEFESSETERDVQADKLFVTGPHGWDTWHYNQALYALEQEDYCDFAIQLEITHNSIHSWIGGSKEHSMAHLHYASYDPIFFIHHSNTDRLWALWQALQKHRGYNPNEINCALEKLKEPLKPFSFGPPYNLNEVTQFYSHPEETLDYQNHFHYHYDLLEFVGMSIPALDAFIKERQERDRVFAGFLLKGLGRSVNVEFEICGGVSNKCIPGGHFSVLGGSAEMPWEFDRLYKYEITHKLKELGVCYDDEYHFKINVKGIDGTVLDSSLIQEPNVIFEAGTHENHVKHLQDNHIRRNLNTLDERDTQSLQAALRNLQEDNTNDGWVNLVSFHGAPARCPDLNNSTVACCQHGMPTFPHWHRLFTLQVEHALRRHGSSVAIPYWDLTFETKELPSIFTKVDYYDAWRDEVLENPFAHGFIPFENTYTVRNFHPNLYTTDDGIHSVLLKIVLEVLEQTDYCNFEVQFEVLHNAFHFIIGGHQKYSLSSLEYSAYDPIFFILHSFIDKIWVVWQKLQQKRHLPYDRADCNVNSMNEQLKPFSFKGFNLNKITRDHATPMSLFDHEELGYGYDNLDIGGYSPDQLEDLIHERQKHGRVFAGFLLKGIKTSGLVTIQICKGEDTCTFSGRFCLLGGPTESPWAYDRLYKKDITNFLKAADLDPEDVFNATHKTHLKVEIVDVYGHTLDENVLPPPTIIYKEPHKSTKDVSPKSFAGVGVRKDVSKLSSSEIQNLREALHKVQADSGLNGFQNIASFHGSPPRCKHNNHSVACCIHGMANFPQWHRLYVKQWEDSLISHGARIGIPYWDWTTVFTHLPALVTAKENNPFHHGLIHKGQNTTRNPRDQLFNDPEHETQSFFYRQVLLAFEQTDYCDFEVQLEITHNAIHSWIGGRSPYSMSTLEYTAYDPLFILHHSNVDRQFAIWQALQKFRGLPYNSANCAIQLLHQPMRPFSDAENVNPTTKANSRASDVFSYDRLNYQYDNLNFHGHTISELNDIIEHQKERDRIFAEFFLHGLKTSADVTFELCDAQNHCEFAGTFAILGGSLEMPWTFDHLFKYDVTDVFEKLHLRPDSEYKFVDHIIAVNGTELNHHLIKPPSVHFVPGVKTHHRKDYYQDASDSDKLLRKSVNKLTRGEALNLKNALHKLQQDKGPSGFEAIAGFHGAPFLCPEKGNKKYACCTHGMPIFPHWHRLFTVQFEQALKEHGSTIGIPYWDWTSPGRTLPHFLTDTDSDNPFGSYTISFEENKKTTRSLKDFFITNTSDGNTILFHLTLDALEEEDFCHFETMLEFLHNEIHFFIGGTGTYSMSTLDYAAFDPIFMIVHSNMDRIWVLWQELQKLRIKPSTAIDCGNYTFNKPLPPFDFPDVNTIPLTRRNVIPQSIFDHSNLGYKYADLDINGYDVEEIHKIIKKRRTETRFYLCGGAHGFGLSLYAMLWFTSDKGEKVLAGKYFLLGSSREMPWSNEILSKNDVTEAFKKAGLSADKPVMIHFTLTHYNDTAYLLYSDFFAICAREAYTDYLTVNLPISDTYNFLPPKLIVPKGTRIRFIPVSEDFNFPMENLVSLTSLDECNVPNFPFNQYAMNKIHALEPGHYYFTSSNATLCDKIVKLYIVIQNH